jgi:hypothetical protein
MPTTAGITYATWNPSDHGTSITLSGGNLTATNSAGGWNSVRATIGKSTGKWYWELQINNSDVTHFILGIGNSSFSVNNYIAQSARSGGVQVNFGNWASYANGVTSDYSGNPTTLSTGNWTGWAFDATAGQLWANFNGTWQNHDPTGADVLSGMSTNGPWYPSASILSGGSPTTVVANFGASAFQFSVPSGFNAGVY